ncbi:MAG: energy-coupling factor ABC transporter ATP-binding protein [Promethearchaeota archaeon]
MIEFRSVWYNYPDGPDILKNINLRIEKGSFVAILGHNGAGKTTLVKCINGLIKPMKGNVIVNGIDTKDVSVAMLARHVGLVFQNPDNQLFASTVHDELDFSLKNLNVPESEREYLIDKTLEKLNLLQFKERSPFLLSGGERKRVTFASLACMNQSVLIADEPTQGQDYLQKKNIKKVLREMHKDGKTIIVISHDLDFITSLATRVIIMKGGQIYFDGLPEDIFYSSRLLDMIEIEPTQAIQLKWFLKKYLNLEAMQASEEELVNIIIDKIRDNKLQN